MAADQNVQTELSRELTLFDITMMGLGMMIGAGVFIGMGPTVGSAGPGGVMVTFALNGLVALFTAFSYAELSSAFTRTGGAYHFARYGFGRGVSFVAGWMEWFASSVAGSLYAVTFAVYVVRFFLALGWLNWVPEPIMAFEFLGIRHFIVVKVVAVLTALFFIYVNYRGASETGKLGALMTFAQTLFLWVIGGIAIVVAFRDPSRFENFAAFVPNGWTRILATMGATYVAFEGYEVIAQAADETVDPKRNLPKAMLYSVLIVTVTYVLVAFATVAAVKVGSPDVGHVEAYKWIAGFREEGFGAAIGQLLPSKGVANLLVTLAVIFASTSALNATIFSATRVFYALGRDGMLPASVAKIHPKRKTPWVALVGTSVLVLSLALLKVSSIAICASMMFLILFFLVNVCVIKVRQNMADELSYGFLMPFYPAIPILALVCQAVLVFWIFKSELAHGSGHIVLFLVPAWILVGVVVYLLYSRHHVKPESAEVQVLEEVAAPGEGYRVMASFADPKNAVQLVGTMLKLCGAKKAEVELLHMVPVPEQTPLGDADEYMLEGKEAIAEAELYLGGFFAVSTTLRYCRNIARGIIGAVRQKHIDMLVMGWHGKTRTQGFSLGSTVDPVIERAPCNVVVVKGNCNQDFKRILVPVAGGPNSTLAMEIAGILADDEEGKITVFSVRTPSYEFSVQDFLDEHLAETGLALERIEVKTVDSHHVISAIMAETENHDAVVMGCTRRPLVYKMTHESIPEKVAKRCDKPLVMVNAAKGIESWLKRWL